jgi:hypothetical protein
VKNTEGAYPAGGSLEVTSYSPEGNIIESDSKRIPMIASGDTIYCTFHFDYLGEEPDFIGWEITWTYYDVTSVAKSSTFALSNVTQHPYATYSKYTGNIKNNNSRDKTVCVNVIYYKDGQMIGGYYETYEVSANSTRSFSMTVYDEPDYDTYKMFVSQYYY